MPLPDPDSSTVIKQGTPGPAKAILIVEDEHLLRTAIVKGLNKRGFLMTEARDGTEAIQLLTDHPGEFAVMLLDLALPGTPSRDVLIKACSVRPLMKVIITSAHPRSAAETLLCDLPISHFIRKPYTIAEISELIRTVLESPQSV